MLNSNPYINTLLENNIADPYTRKLVATGYSAALKTAMLEGKTVEKEVSMSGYTPTTGRFIDGDTIEFIDPKTNQPVVGRITAGSNFFDTVDKLKAMQDSKPKLKHQPSAIDSITGSRAVDEFTAKNMSNYQAQQMLNQFSEKPEFSTYDPNTVYESVADTSVNMGIRVTGTDDYGRALVEVINPTTKRNVGVDASNNPYLNTRFDFYKSLDTAKNRSKMNPSDESFLDNVNLQALYNEISDTDGRLPEDIDIAQSTAYRAAARVLQYLPFMDREHWAAVADEATGQQIADAWAGVKMSTRRDYANGMLEASNAWKAGDYAKAITGWISNIDRVIAESATQTGLILVGSQAAAAAGAGATIAGLSGALLATADATLASMESYEANNNGQKMSAEQVAQSFALNFVTMIPETMLTALNVQRFLPKPVAKEFNILFKTKDDIKKTPAYKTVLESAGGEFGQEWVQSGVEEYVSQNQENAKSLSEVMTSGERIENAIVGALAGGATSGGLAVANTALDAKAAKKQAQHDATQTELDTVADTNSSNTWNSFNVDNLSNISSVEDIEKIMAQDAETLKNNEHTGALSVEAKENRRQYIKTLFNSISDLTDVERTVKTGLMRKLYDSYGVTRAEAEQIITYGMLEDAAKLADEKGITVEELTAEDLDSIIEKYRNMGLGTHARMSKEEIISDLQTVAADLKKGESSYIRYEYELQSIQQKLEDESLSDSARKTLEDEKAAYAKRVKVLLDNAVNKFQQLADKADELADNPDAQESSKTKWLSGKGKPFSLRRADFFNTITNELNGLGSIAGGLSVVSDIRQEAVELNEIAKTYLGIDLSQDIAKAQNQFLNAQDAIHGIDSDSDSDSDSQQDTGPKGPDTAASSSSVGSLIQKARNAIASLNKATSKQVRTLARKELLNSVNDLKTIKDTELTALEDEELQDSLSNVQAIRDNLAKLRASKNYSKEQKEADLTALDTLAKLLHNEINRRQSNNQTQTQTGNVNTNADTDTASDDSDEDDEITSQTEVDSDKEIATFLQNLAISLDTDEASINTVDELIAKTSAFIQMLKQHGDDFKALDEFKMIVSETSSGVRRSARGQAILSRTLKVLRNKGFLDYAKGQEQHLIRRKKGLDSKFKGSESERAEISEEISNLAEELENKISKRTRGKATTVAELEARVETEITALEEKLNRLASPNGIQEDVKDTPLIQDYGDQTSDTVTQLNNTVVFKNDAESVLATIRIDTLIAEAEDEDTKTELSEIQKLLVGGRNVIRASLPNGGNIVETTYTNGEPKSNIELVINEIAGKKTTNRAYGYLNSVVVDNPIMHILGAITKTTSRTKNTIQFNLNETVSDIIVSSAMEYVSTYDMFSLLNPTEDSEILKAFGKNEHDYDSLEECKQILKSQGIPQSVLVNGLGSLIARNLGVHPKATANMFAYPQIASFLGTIALNYCEKAKLVTVNSSVNTYNGKQITNRYIKGDFDRLRKAKDFYKSNNIAKHLKAVKDSSFSREPRTTTGNPPMNMTLKTKLKLTSVPGYYQAVIRELWNTPFTIDKDLVNLMITNKEAFKKRLGYVDVNDPSLTFEQKESAKGINMSIDKQIEDLENALKSIDEGGYADANGDLVPIFFNWFMSSNGRLFMQSSTINPQTGKKLQRFLVTPSASYKTFSFTEQEIKEEAYAIAQAFNSLDDNASIDLFHSVMTSLAKKDLDALESYVINGITDDNRAVMCKIFKKLKYDKKTIDLIKEGKSNEELLELENFGQALNVVKHLKQRVANKKAMTPFTTNLMVENDSTTSGYDLKFLLFPELQQQGKDYLPNKTGILLGEDIDKVSDTHSLKATEGFLDIYKTAAVSAWNNLPSCVVNLKGSDRAIFDLLEPALPKIEGNKVSKALRSLMKGPTMIFGYSASEKSLERKVADQLAEDLVKDFMKIDTKQFNAFEKGAHDTIDTRTLAILKAFKKLDIRVKGKGGVKQLNTLGAIRASLQSTPINNIIVVTSSTNKSLVSYLSENIFNPTYGKATSKALTQSYQSFIEVNDVLNTATKLMSKCLQNSIENALEQLTQAGVIITEEQYKLILEQHRELFPEIPLLFSEDTVDGLNLVNASKMTTNVKDASVLISNADGSIDIRHSSIEAFGISDPGLRGAVLPIHFTDGMLLMMTMHKHKGILPVFDALVMSAFGSTEASQDYNRYGILIGKQFNLLERMFQRFQYVTQAYKYSTANNKTLPPIGTIEVDKLTVGKLKFNSIKEFENHFAAVLRRVNSRRDMFYSQNIGHVNMAGAVGSKAVVTPDEHLDLADMQAINAKNRTYFYPSENNERFYPDDTIQEVFGNLNSTERILTAFDMLTEKAKQLGGEETDVEYLNELRSILSNIDPTVVQNVELRVQEQANSMTGAYQIEQGTRRIYVGFNPKKKTSSLANIGNTAAETFAHEVIHAATVAGIEAHAALGVTKEIKQLEALRGKALNVITWRDFMPDNYEESNKAALERIAKNNYNKVFDVKEPNSLAEFLAVGTTNKKIMRKLKTISLKETTESLYERIISTLKNVFNVLFGKVTLSKGLPRVYAALQGHTSKSDAANIQEALLDLTAAISAAGYEASKTVKSNKFNLLNSVIKAFGGIVVKGDTMTGPAVQKLTNILKNVELSDVLINSMEKKQSFSTLVKAFSLALASKKARYQLREFLFKHTKLAKNQLFMSLLKDFQDTDDASKELERIGLHTRNLDANIQQNINIARQSLNAEFGRELTREERRSLTVAALRTDLSCLVEDANVSNLDEIKTLLTDGAALTAKIDEARKAIESIKDSSKFKAKVFNRIKALSYYMVTGNGNFDLHFSANHIVNDITKYSNYSDTDIKNLTTAVDKLVTYYAIELTDSNVKQQLVTLPDEGLKNFLALHNRYTKDSKNRKNDFRRYIKGSVKTLGAPDIHYSMTFANPASIPYGVTPIAEVASKTEGLKNLLVLRENFYTPPHREGATFAFVDSKVIGDSFLENTDLDTSLDVDFVNKIRRFAATTAAKFDKKELSFSNIADMSVPFIPVPKFTQPAATDVDLLSIEDNTFDYRIIPNYDIIENQMSADMDGIEILSNMFGHRERNMTATDANKIILNFLIKDAKENMDKTTKMLKNPDGDFNKAGIKYITLSKNKIELSSDEYRLLPDVIKNYIHNGKTLYIREDWLPDLFGVKSISTANLFSNPKWKYFAKVIEHTLKAIALVAKNNIVFRTPAVVVGNIIGNMVYCVLTGNNIIDVTKAHIKYSQALTDYLQTRRDMEVLQLKQATRGVTLEEEKKIRWYQNHLENSIVHPLIKAGLFQAIIEDIDVTRNETVGGLARKLKETKVYNKSPKWVKEIARQAFMVEGTFLHDTIFKATQYSDFVSRCVQYEFLMKKAGLTPGDKHTKSKEDAIISEILEAFINYDKPSSSIEQWMNDMGLVMFTKYFKRIQRVIRTQATTRPISSLLFTLSQMSLVDVDDIFEQNLVSKNYGAIVHTPLDNIISAFTPQLVNVLS